MRAEDIVMWGVGVEMYPGGLPLDRLHVQSVIAPVGVKEHSNESAECQCMRRGGAREGNRGGDAQVAVVTRANLHYVLKVLRGMVGVSPSYAL